MVVCAVAPRVRSLITLAALALACVQSAARGEVYRVGPGLDSTAVSQIADKLNPGDVVEITGDIKDRFVISRSGTPDRPIVIRGITSISGDHILRPKVIVGREAISLEDPKPEARAFAQMTYGITLRGAWCVLEGLDISGAIGQPYGPDGAVLLAADNLVVRNCAIHDCCQAIVSDPESAGSMLVEFCDLSANGRGLSYQTVRFCSNRPGATGILQFCHFSDANGGVFFMSRHPRVVVRYNWFENSYVGTLLFKGIIVAPGNNNSKLMSLFPMHADIVGNVFFQGWSAGINAKMVEVGGGGEDDPGPEGTFTFAHNLFIVTRKWEPIHEQSYIVTQGIVDGFRLYNNVFLEYGNLAGSLYLRYPDFDLPETENFKQRRGGSDAPTVEGDNNWISQSVNDVPTEFRNSTRGVNPHFAGLTAFDFHPLKDSVLAGAGMWPLPKGQIVDLAPEYEPQRRIPVDLKPKARRKVTPPSIGPFEVAEELGKSH